jgi:hypothetical protein
MKVGGRNSPKPPSLFCGVGAVSAVGMTHLGATPGCAEGHGPLATEGAARVTYFKNGLRTAASPFDLYALTQTHKRKMGNRGDSFPWPYPSRQTRGRRVRHPRGNAGWRAVLVPYWREKIARFGECCRESPAMFLTRRQMTTTLAATALLPAVARAQQAAPRRSVDAGITFPSPGRRAWADAVPRLGIGLLGGENEADRLGRFDARTSNLLQETFKPSPCASSPPATTPACCRRSARSRSRSSSLGASGYAGAWLDTNGGVDAAGGAGGE